MNSPRFGVVTSRSSSSNSTNSNDDTNNQQNNNATKRKTAAAVIIGNEILSGKVSDVNVAYLAKLLFARGVKLCRVEMIADDYDEIGEAVVRLSQKVDYVFTSGGIGPTLDDITYAAIAKAFGVSLVCDDRILCAMKEISPQHEINVARRQMATVPTGAELLAVEGLWVPLAVVNGNVFILPGVPWLFQRMLDAHKGRFGDESAALATARVYTNRFEGEIAASLNQLHADFPDVELGSYPRTEVAHNYCVMLTLEGADEARVHAARDQLKRAVDGELEPGLLPQMERPRVG
eukprot:CAMPEP_0185849464 /NCGR_PEP_ID=MMETSP1354-20130828/3964_1 /TAXON_ID=708628 /ORGANISM="Erythrolobus madagascarensis, Strain CCMP3276" /LENGTH=290 /DNA_ID=CAMNT_0028549997 /DNA_START=258 /DNA_END=1130 /DNA_ORIENTATION=+